MRLTSSKYLTPNEETRAIVDTGANDLIALWRERKERPRISRDLWPTSFKTLDSAISQACSPALSLNSARELATWPLNQQNLDALMAAQKALPDYSEAQLRRAIAERQ